MARQHREGTTNSPPVRLAHRRRRPSNRESGSRRQRGASIVEFALVAPVLFAVVFGIIDWGMLLSDTIGLRQGVREAGRQASVADYGSSTSCGLTGVATSDNLAPLICLTKSRSDVAASSVRVAIRVQKAGTNVAVGDGVVVCTLSPMKSISGFYEPVMRNRYVRSKVSMRIEKVDSAKPLVDKSETAWSGQDWSWCTV